MTEVQPSPSGGSTAALLDELAQALPAGFLLRERVDADLQFLGQLYATTREEELRAVQWPDEHKAAFLLDQFSKQHSHYLTHYPRAQWLVLECKGQPMGRLYIDAGRHEIRVMDIAWLPAFRRHGLGSSMMKALIAHADREALQVTLHVEPANPARGLYFRLGFEDVEAVGFYMFMRRPARS